VLKQQVGQQFFPGQQVVEVQFFVWSPKLLFCFQEWLESYFIGPEQPVWKVGSKLAITLFEVELWPFEVDLLVW